jgi:WD40 repeat protein
MSARAVWFTATAVTITGCSHLYQAEDVDQWQAIGTIPAQRLPVASLAFSSDGKRLLSTHAGLFAHNERPQLLFHPAGVMRIWDLRMDGFLWASEMLAARSIRGLKFHQIPMEPGSSEGRVVVQDGDTTSIVACDMAKLEWSTEQSNVSIADVSSDGRYRADLRSSGDYDSVRFTDSESGAFHDAAAAGSLSWPWGFLGTAFYCVEDGHNTDFHDLRIWDATSGESITSLRLAHDPFYIALSPGVSGGFHAASAEYESATFEVVHVGIPKHTFELTVESGTIHGLAISPQGDLVAVCGEDDIKDAEVGFVEIRDIDTGTRISRTIDDSSWGITAVAFSPDGKQLAAGTAAGEILFLQPRSTTPGNL